MDNIIPSASPNVLTDEEWGLALQAQFENSIPANTRPDIMQRWVQQYLKCTFDPSESTSEVAYMDPDDLELHLFDGMQVQFEDLKNRVADLFRRHYSIIIEEEADFFTYYSLYTVFVQGFILYAARYVHAWYTINVKSKTVTEGPAISTESFTPVDEVVGAPDLIDDTNSHEFGMIESVLMAGDFSIERFIELASIDSPGNVYLGRINECINGLFSVTVEDPDVFAGRIHSEINDVSVVEALVRKMGKVK